MLSPIWNEGFARVSKSLWDADVSNTRVQYNNTRQRWFSHMVYVCQWPVNSVLNHTIAIDPGIRNFVTAFATDGVCHSFRCFGVVRERQPQPWDVLRDTLHAYIIKLLVCSYRRIYLPPTFTPWTPACPQPALHTIQTYMAASYALFRERLCTAAAKTGCVVLAADELFSSQTCSRCGLINRCGTSTVFKCASCGMVSHRDVNASKNILVSNFSRSVAASPAKGNYRASTFGNSVTGKSPSLSYADNALVHRQPGQKLGAVPQHRPVQRQGRVDGCGAD